MWGSVEGRLRERSKDQLTECYNRIQSSEQGFGHTSGGLRYSIPMLRECLVVFSTSFIKLYRSTLKLRVGPADNLTIRSEGAIGVMVNASK